MMTPHLSMFWGNRDASEWYYVSQFPAKFAHQNLDILLIGDSRAKSAWIPDKNKKNYNLAIGGATPIEGLITLEQLIANKIKFKHLVISYSPSHLVGEDSYWRRTVNFQYINFFRHLRLRIVADKLGDTGYFRKDKTYLSHALLGSKGDQISFSLDGTRRRLGLLNLELIEKNQGHSFYGRADSAPGLPEEFLKPLEFNLSPLADQQLQQILYLAKREKIKIHWAYTPYSSKACPRLPKMYIHKYVSYINSLGINQLNQFGCAPDEMFGDSSHLYKGALVYSQMLNQILEKL